MEGCRHGEFQERLGHMTLLPWHSIVVTRSCLAELRESNELDVKIVLFIFQ